SEFAVLFGPRHRPVRVVGRRCHGAVERGGAAQVVQVIALETVPVGVINNAVRGRVIGPPVPALHQLLHLLFLGRGAAGKQRVLERGDVFQVLGELLQLGFSLLAALDGVQAGLSRLLGLLLLGRAGLPGLLLQLPGAGLEVGELQEGIPDPDQAAGKAAVLAEDAAVLLLHLVTRVGATEELPRTGDKVLMGAVRSALAREHFLGSGPLGARRLRTGRLGGRRGRRRGGARGGAAGSGSVGQRPAAPPRQGLPARAVPPAEAVTEGARQPALAHQEHGPARRGQGAAVQREARKARPEAWVAPG